MDNFIYCILGENNEELVTGIFITPDYLPVYVEAAEALDCEQGTKDGNDYWLYKINMFFY